jgi:hypothetical protein
MKLSAVKPYFCVKISECHGNIIIINRNWMRGYAQYLSFHRKKIYKLHYENIH